MKKEAKYAYVAGIIDGDGCIQIHRNKPHTGWTLRVVVTMQSKKIIDHLVGIVGGNYSSTIREDNEFVIYSWCLCGSKAYKALKKIKPYLTEKKPQADGAIQFFLHQKNYGVRVLTEKEIEIREGYRTLLTQLKKKFLTPKSAPAETECENAIIGEATVRPS